MEFSIIEKIQIVKDVLSDSGIQIDFDNEGDIIDSDNFDEVAMREYIVLSINKIEYREFDLNWFEYRCKQEGISYFYEEDEEDENYVITIHDIRIEDRTEREDLVEEEDKNKIYLDKMESTYTKTEWIKIKSVFTDKELVDMWKRINHIKD